MSGEPFGPPGTVYISGGAIPVAAIPLAAASRLLQNSRIGLNVARAEVAGQHGKKLSPGRGACTPSVNCAPVFRLPRSPQERPCRR